MAGEHTRSGGCGLPHSGVKISNKEVFSFLQYECGVAPNCKKWLTPNWIFYATRNIKRAYLMGIFDAEGSVLRKRNFYEIQISQKSRSLLEEIKKIIAEFDIK
ncbi:MAG: LAGLIDADG family homing endonuclease, partial [Candidatus Aenigmatarchaeota archaeon]